MNGLDKGTKLELLRIGASKELPKAIARVNALQRILGVKTRQAKAGLTAVVADKSSSWTPAKRRAAAARMRQYWKERREEEATKGGRRKAS